MKFKKYIQEETVANFDKTVKKIVKMTANNDHTSALVAGLKLLGDDTKSQQAKNLARKIDKAGGYGPDDPLDKETKKLYRSMMNTAKAGLTSSEYKKFNKAF